MTSRQAIDKQYHPGVWVRKGYIDGKIIGFIASTPKMDDMIPKKLRDIQYIPVYQWEDNSYVRNELKERWHPLERIMWGNKVEICRPNEYYILDKVFPKEKFTVFSHCSNLRKIHGLQNLDVSNITDLSEMFYETAIIRINGLETWDVSRAIDMSRMFSGCSICNFDSVKNWDVSNVKNLARIFSGNTIKNADAFANWDVSHVEDFSAAFESCSKMSDISALGNWDVSNAITMDSVFACCNKLTDVSAIADWDTSNVRSFHQSFYSCTRLSNSALSALSKWSMKSIDICAKYYSGNHSYSFVTTEQIISGALASHAVDKKTSLRVRKQLKNDHFVKAMKDAYGDNLTLGALSMHSILSFVFKDAEAQESAVKAYKAGVPLEDIIA